MIASTTNSTSRQQQQQQEPQQQHIVLFYKYHALSEDKEKTEVYRHSLEKLCSGLNLTGRILVGCSQTEGINGTLAGKYLDLEAFQWALLGREKWKQQQQRQEEEDSTETMSDQRIGCVNQFWEEAQDFFQSIDQPVLTMDSTEDFKWSHASTQQGNIKQEENEEQALFPDLNIKLVKELIGTGGALSSISLEETAKGYLTPKEWHEEMTKLKNINGKTNDSDTILIDCRNTKECQVGHFQGAVDPNTTTFAQFPHWVGQHKHMLQDKRVLMYCTGGIRCEKASAYIRRQVPSAKAVQHLKGGIHKYLEAMDKNLNDTEEAVWQGKNFVFHTPVQTELGISSNSTTTTTTTNETRPTSNATTVVGRCIYCEAPYDNFDPRCVCTVCREPTLSCQDCQENISEFHCKQHFHLRDCYFSNLTVFSGDELQKQLQHLETILVEIAVGKRFKQKRKTLQKQCSKIRQRLMELGDGGARVTEAQKRCRNCDDITCSGRCWGFFSLKRKEALEQRQMANQAATDMARPPPKPAQDKKKRGTNERNRDRNCKEIVELNLSLPPSSHRDPETGIRVPPPCTRVLQTRMKGKWKGKPVLALVKEEFHELSKEGVLERLLECGLLRVNDVPVTQQNGGKGLMTGDTISRIVHWHEPPVIVPDRIGVQKISLADDVKAELGIESNNQDGSDIYVCNKPSSLPVHPAGPYLANSLTLMVEAQEQLSPHSLSPCHRTDRVTSGLTICCTSPTVARVIQRSMCEKQVKKLYLARVHGKFVATEKEASMVRSSQSSLLAQVQYTNDTNCVQVDAPVETVDPSDGIRKVTEAGKPATSLYRLLSYDDTSNVSLVACQPITGRSHQLRVHLQLLGFPIVGDVLYGGKGLNEDMASKRMAQAIDMLTRSTKRHESELELRVRSVTDRDATLAKSACGLCQPLESDSDHSMFARATSCFSPAQLLESGHAIDLHASRYRIDILPSKKRVDELADQPVDALDLTVESPPWASTVDTTSLPWLDNPSPST